MTPFIWLLVAHLLGDWIFQTDYQALNKARGGLNRALITHCLTYTLTFMPVFWLSGISLGWLAFIFVAHVFIDRRAPVIWFLKRVKGMSDEALKKAFFMVIMTDQVIHVVTLVVVVVATYGWLTK